MMDPNRIDAIRFGIDIYDGNKGIFEGRFASEKHNRDGGWYPIDIESLDIDRQLIDRAKRKPMTTVELADGSREINMDSSSDCGLAHSSVERPIVFRAKSNSQSCVLAAYGNAISISIDSERKGLDAVQTLIDENVKLLNKDAGNRVCQETGIQTTKVKMPINEYYKIMMTRGANGKFMDGAGGLYVASPETHESAAGHMIAIDADLGLIYDCAEPKALPLTVENLDRCAGDYAMCVGFLRMRQLLKPALKRKARGSRGGCKKRRKQLQEEKKRDMAVVAEP